MGERTRFARSRVAATRELCSLEAWQSQASHPQTIKIRCVQTDQYTGDIEDFYFLECFFAIDIDIECTDEMVYFPFIQIILPDMHQTYFDIYVKDTSNEGLHNFIHNLIQCMLDGAIVPEDHVQIFGIVVDQVLKIIIMSCFLSAVVYLLDTRI